MDPAAKKRRLHEKQKEIGALIIRKYSNLTEYDEHGAQVSDNSEKEFLNMDATAPSPPGRSPPFDSKKLELMEFELSAPRVRLQDRSRLFFLVNCISCIKFYSTFHLKMISNGGWYYLIPFVFCLIVFASPMAFLEMSLGQYTSNTSLSIYKRMAPITAGLGLAIVILRFLFMLIYRTEHRFLIFVLEMIRNIFFDNRNTMCRNPDHHSCYIPNVCANNTVFFWGACYDRMELIAESKMSSEMNIRLAAAQLIQDPDFYGLGINPIPEPDRVLEGMSRYTSVFYLMFILFVASFKGIRWMSKASSVIMCSAAILLPCCLAFLLIVNPSCRDGFVDFVGIMNLASEPKELYNHAAWGNALFSAFFALCVADGTLQSLGAMNSFNNNIARDIGVMTLSSLIISILSIFFFGMITIVGIRIEINEFDRLYQTTDQDLLEKMQQQPLVVSYMNPFYFFTWLGHTSNYVTSVIFFLCVVLQIAPHVLLAENVICWSLRVFHDLVLIPESVVRHCVLILYFTLFGAIYSLIHFLFPNEYETFGWMSSVILLAIVCSECKCIHTYYGVERFLVNVYTMFSDTPWLYRFTKRSSRVAFHLWTTVIPVSCSAFYFCGILAVFRIIGVHSMSLIVFFIANLTMYAACRKAVLTWAKNEQIPNIFLSSTNWGPFTVTDKKNANFDERAARIDGTFM